MATVTAPVVSQEPPAPTPAPPTPPPYDPGPLLAAVDQIGGVEVAVVSPDGKLVAASAGASSPTFTASLVKLHLVSELLARGPVEASALELARRAIVSSDDAAASALWVRYDGAELVRASAARLGATVTAPPARLGQWGETVISAVEYGRLLASLDSFLDPASFELLSSWLRASSEYGADGFDQSFGLWGSAGVKQGWMLYASGRRYLHSAGLLPDGTAVVLLGVWPSGSTWASARAALDSAATAVLASLP